ncbi:MAG: hypothetical protein Kow0088_00780 [Anaerolineales bacterium]
MIQAEGSPEKIPVEIYADGKVSKIYILPNSTVGQAIQAAQIALGQLDRVEPPLTVYINEPLAIRVIRVREEFEVERTILPFEKKVVQTESLPEQVTLLAQKGQNGEAELTYRILYEDGVEVSRTMVNEPTILKEAVPEIMMVGVQKPFVVHEIPGRIVYLLGGNAWMIEGNTANRILLVSSGDLDGRIFRLSQDGEWLLFTRRENEEGMINSLWAAHLVNFDKPVKLINLNVTNVVHFADLRPMAGAIRVYFSTVEPRSTAPGWQANNNLLSLDFSPNGWISKWKTLVETNSGGVYGWWGTTFALEPRGERIAFARPDGVGILGEEGEFDLLHTHIPYQTGADWAWVPGISWSPDGKFIYTVDHVTEAGLANPEESKSFAITALSVETRNLIHLIQDAGMFSIAIPSPMTETEQGLQYRLAYLQAVQPEQSDVSPYQLMVMDQDGSDARVLFPVEGDVGGLEPQRIAWSPGPLQDTGEYAIAVIYEGNLYLVDVSETGDENGEVRQITGDGLVSRVVWSLNQ